jgi:hypothetical protein
MSVTNNLSPRSLGRAAHAGRKGRGVFIDCFFHPFIVDLRRFVEFEFEWCFTLFVVTPPLGASSPGRPLPHLRATDAISTSTVGVINSHPCSRSSKQGKHARPINSLHGRSTKTGEYRPIDRHRLLLSMLGTPQWCR